MTTKAAKQPKNYNIFQRITGSIRARTYMLKGFTTLVLALGAFIIAVPLLFMISTAIKDRNQLRASPPPLIPWAATMVEVAGKEEGNLRILRTTAGQFWRK